MMISHRFGGVLFALLSGCASAPSPSLDRSYERCRQLMAVASDALELETRTGRRPAKSSTGSYHVTNVAFLHRDARVAVAVNGELRGTMVLPSGRGAAAIGVDALEGDLVEVAWAFEAGCALSYARFCLRKEIEVRGHHEVVATLRDPRMCELDLVLTPVPLAE